MKQILFSILSFILCFLFSGCADIPTSAGASDISSMIAYEIENLEGAENFDEFLTPRINTLTTTYIILLNQSKPMTSHNINKHLFLMAKMNGQKKFQKEAS